jgi:hypothetical protein
MPVPPAEPRLRISLALGAAALALAAAPGRARALQLLDEELSLAGGGGGAPPVLHVALAAEPPAGPMDFDLLGTPSAPPDTAKEDARMRKRRQYLQWHQRVGLAVGSLELATVVVGQLNYNDKFGTANTGRYELSHAVLAYTTFAAFAVGGTLALLAPRPVDKPSRGWDRMRVHKIGMALATAGMIAQAVYGIQTRNREGYLDKEQIAQTHLVIGYATLAASAVAVGVLVF